MPKNAQQISSLPSSRKGGVGTVLLIVLLLTVIGIGGFLVSSAGKEWMQSLNETEGTISPDYVLHTAEVGSFRISITENGTVDSLRNATLKSTVEGSTTIISLVPEGSMVQGPVIADFDGVVQYVDMESESEKAVSLKADDGTERQYSIPMGQFTEVLVEDGAKVRKGDYLAGDIVCELDGSSMEESQQQQQINVTAARANLEKAETNLKIQKGTNEKNLDQAKLAEKLAKLDYVKYTADGGEYQQSVETLEGEIRQLEQQLSIAQETYEQTREQARRGYENLNNLESTRIAVDQARILLNVKKSEMTLLERFTRERTESELNQTAKDTERDTERTILEGEAAMAQMESDLYATQQMLEVEEEKLDRLIRQIKACRMVAPQPGEVVYASQQNRRSEPIVIEEGATVRERQAVVNLPDLTAMKIDARIHESRISRIQLGQPAEVSIDAVSNVMFHGILDTISSVPVPGSWPNSDLKEYEAEIRITDDESIMRRLKPGMTAEVRIIIDDRTEDVLQIPVQSVIAVLNNFYTYAVEGNKVVRRELKVGDANDEFMEILDGIQEGDQVVMNPRTHFSKEINELEAQLTAEMEDKRTRFGTSKTMAPRGPAKRKPPQPASGGGFDPVAIFKRIDKNGDGVVTSDESDMRGNFDNVDADGDGKITSAEFAESMKSMQGGR